MPNIIGEPLRPYVQSQIKTRQDAHGSGVKGNRTPEQLSYLNSKTAWIKLASGISASGKRTKSENLRDGLSGITLAKNYILFGGISRLEGDKLTPRGNSSSKNNIYSYTEGAYNVTGQGINPSGEMGLVPMPGIVDASIKCENRGSIKKATVNIKCYSPEQFKILDLLYLRIGYTMLLEWGWAPYLDNNGNLVKGYPTLIENEFFSSNEESNLAFLEKIENERKKHSGNYDGLLCRVTNFSWNFNQDGTYDVQLNLISLGDIIESLKVNLAPTKEVSEYIIGAYKLYGEEEIDEKQLKENPPSPATNILSAYFFVQRIYLTENPENDNYWSLKSAKDAEFTAGGNPIEVPTRKIIPPANKVIESNQTKDDFVYFNYNTLVDDEDVLNDDGFYIRFGHLLEFIQDNCIFKIKSKFEDSIKIDFDEESNRMYVFPYQVSLDPRVCIVSSTKELVNTKEYYKGLKPWKVLNNDHYGKIMNIYLNCNMVNRIITEKQDENGNVALFELLNSICTELNKALGNLNNLDVSIDEDTSVIKIIDASYVPTLPTKNTVLELYGYDGSTSNFVYDFNIKTEITNDFATMASVGSTAGGYVKGTENTMFSKWNKGLVDRFKDEYIPPAKSKEKSEDIQKEPPIVYAEEFWNKKYAPFGLTPPQDVANDIVSDDICALSAENIDKNLTIVDEFYKYCQYKIQQTQEKYASPSAGFIPISLGITLEGISGIKIYNYLEVSTRILPANYPDSLKFIIKGVNHKIADGKWETGIETVVIANIFNEDGKPILSYNEIKDKVKSIIDDGTAKSKNQGSESKKYTPPVRLANTSPEALAAAISNGIGLAATTIGGVGSKTLGTAGRDAPVANLSRDALSAQTIEQIVEDSGARNSPVGSLIRSRIVEIAASYVGQFEIENPGQNIHGNKKTYAQNPGWWDPDYQAKFANADPILKYSNWTPSQPWCAWFCQVVWREAHTTGNAYVKSMNGLQYEAEYKDIWNNYLSAGGAITAGVSTAKANFQKLKKFITLQDALTGRSLPEPGDIAVYNYGHVDLVIKPFITDGKLTGFSAIGGNTGAGDARNGGETKYYARKGDWKSVVGFCKVVTPFTKDTDYASSPPSGLPSVNDSNSSTDSKPKQPTFEELQQKSATSFNSLTYRLALIWTLKDNYGQNGKPLLDSYKGGNDDEDGAVESVKNWFKKPEQQSSLDKLTDKDREQFNKYLIQLYSRTKYGGDNVTFKSAYNKKVKDKTINPNF
jgi:hypothetical protein